MTAEYEDIQWDSFCAEWIRSHQMWLTSDRRVERIDGEQSLSSIQKRMQNIIEEEVDDHLSSEVSSMLNKCDSILSHKKGVAIVKEDIGSVDSPCEFPKQERSSWMTDFINLHLLPSHDPLSLFVFSCLTDCLSNDWKTRHGACSVLCAYARTCTLQPRVAEAVLFVVLVLLFSDCFMDVSADILQVPVRTLAVQCVAALAQRHAALQQRVALVIQHLQATGGWREAEAWLWRYNLALLLASKPQPAAADFDLACAWLCCDDYATHHVLLRWFCRWWEIDARRCRPYLQPAAQRVSALLASHNYLSEWCCALPDYLRLLGIALQAGVCPPPAVFQPMADYMTGTLFGAPCTAAPLSTLLAFYAQHSTEAVWREAFAMLRHCPCDAPALRLLFHAVATEAGSLRASAIEVAITVLQAMADCGKSDAKCGGKNDAKCCGKSDAKCGGNCDGSDGGNCDGSDGGKSDAKCGDGSDMTTGLAGTSLSAIQQAVFDSLPLLLPPLPYAEVPAFDAASSCKWCFFHPSERVDRELLTVLLSATDRLGGLRAVPRWPRRSQLVFCLLHAPAVLQSLLRVHYHAVVDLSSAAGDLPVPVPVAEESRPCPELEWARAGLEKLLQNY
ncbi:hypothetical protein BLSTO_05165, partial [Blastocystis sp. subtype 1]